jgi:hypothetical protein
MRLEHREATAAATAATLLSEPDRAARAVLACRLRTLGAGDHLGAFRRGYDTAFEDLVALA